MLIYLLFISGMYLALGFSLGWKVTRATDGDWAFADEHSIEESEDKTPHGPKDDRGEIIYQVQELPPQWVEQLENVQECRSFVEATTQILTLEVGRYRDSLVALDSRIRKFLDDPNSPEIEEKATDSTDTNNTDSVNDATVESTEPASTDDSLKPAEEVVASTDQVTEAVVVEDAPTKEPDASSTINESESDKEGSNTSEQPLAEATATEEPKPSDSEPLVIGAKTIIQIKRELLTLNQNWLNRQIEANDVLTSKHDTINTQKNFADQLQHIVASQMAQVETSASNIANFPDEMPPVECAQRLVLELGVMLKLTHKLRDLILDTMCDILATEGRLGSCSDESLHDSWTGTRNRVGLEVVHQQWCDLSPGSEKTLSYVLFDADGFHKLNAQLGARLCDHYVTSIGKSVDGLLRKKGLSDTTSRINGQQYLVLLGNTNIAGARSFAERVRQTISQQKFEYQNGSVNISVTCGVTDFRPDDTVKSVIARLNNCLDIGKEGGRNCVVIDDGSGTERMDALSLDLKELNNRIDSFVQEDANTPTLEKSASGH